MRNKNTLFWSNVFIIEAVLALIAGIATMQQGQLVLGGILIVCSLTTGMLMLVIHHRQKEKSNNVE